MKAMLTLCVGGKKLQNHAIYVWTIEKTIKMILNVYVVVKKLKKFC